MNADEQKKVRDAAIAGLDQAIKTWGKVRQVMLENYGMESRGIPVMDSATASNIPGHPFVDYGKPEATEFVAMVVDMRNSTDRLQNLQRFEGIEDGFQRVYYETSALLPALATTALLKGGHVTEYLGDGALILFKVDTDDRGQTVKDAYRAASDCVTTSRGIVNELLSNRFRLPALNIGAGLSMSHAIVTLVGTRDFMQAKAIGTCVWEATKLSSGVNAVHVSQKMRDGWPTGKVGTISFSKLNNLPPKLTGFSVSER
ncbi:hypothetical protein [Pseudomonas fluorescens]|uniref:Guanylate cyclase domain-containing protein n=1 Tax=Pseudomonas fluorescens TaxID=294 RepID=A0A0F4V684_PSEFL|nr:hypothetical protein [Pseudomonas fluorescens]KJZ64378.1 hypothetical protein VD17_18050 [Pseudomonas fluorescens]